MVSALASRSGWREALTTSSACGPVSSPFSTNSTNPRPTLSFTMISPEYRSLVLWYLLPLSVPDVARTPTTPLRVRCTAGLMAGSMPTNGMSYSALKVEMAAAVAVLHARTITSAPLERKWSHIFLHLSWMKSGLLSPYGQKALSEK
ncbi:unknown [Bacteroides sp. CAG:1060]|nr:unknown [Bacteroides sp. CAG:1060]